MLTIKNTVSKHLMELIRKELVNYSTYNSLNAKVSRLPFVCGHPKVQISRSSLKPTMSVVNSSYHQLARWLEQLSGPICGKLEANGVKYSFQSYKGIDGWSIQNNIH